MIQDSPDIAKPKQSDEFLEYYKRIRKDTEGLAAPPAIEDYMIEAMTEASPTKWHLGHTSWFFEAFILKNSQSWKRLKIFLLFLLNLILLRMRNIITCLILIIRM